MTTEVMLLERLRDVEEKVKERTSGIRWAVLLSILNLVLNGVSVFLLYMIYTVLASAHGAVHAVASAAPAASASSGTQQIAVISGVSPK